jgi:hypothetical protein
LTSAPVVPFRSVRVKTAAELLARWIAAVAGQRRRRAGREPEGGGERSDQHDAHAVHRGKTFGARLPDSPLRCGFAQVLCGKARKNPQAWRSTTALLQSRLWPAELADGLAL